MNYEPNATHWKIGDYVLHDADAKVSDMLMRVVGYAKNGDCLTRYAIPNQMNGWRTQEWRNPLSVLHDPRRLGIAVHYPASMRQSKEKRTSP